MTKKKLTIALDADDCCFFQCNQHALRKLNAMLGTSFELEDISQWNIEEDSPLANLYKFYDDVDFYREQPAIMEGLDLVNWLRKRGHRVVCCTAVPFKAADIRANRLCKEFGFSPADIIITSAKDLVRCDILLDDSPKNIINSVAKRPVLMRRPWNSEVSGVTNVNSFEEFKEIVRNEENGFFEGLKEPGIICLVGPSGSGKTAITEMLVQEEGFGQPRSTTTRERRQNETMDSYNFITKEDFMKRKNAGQFLEHTVYAGNCYGMEKSEVERILLSGKHAILPIDINGAIALKRYYKEKCLTVFVNRKKEGLISSILERSIPDKEKVTRILSIEREKENSSLCDVVLDNNRELHETTEALKIWIKGENDGL